MLGYHLIALLRWPVQVRMEANTCLPASLPKRVLPRMTSILRPPAELGTWNGYEGCSRDLLNDADGYLLELISSKLGLTPPFSAPAD